MLILASFAVTYQTDKLGFAFLVFSSNILKQRLVCRKALFWGLFFSMYSLMIYNTINYRKLLNFADDLKNFRIFISSHDCLLLQSDINSASDWCTDNSMSPSITKTHVMSFTMKINFLSYEYQFCHATITHTSSIKDLGVFFHSKLHFHRHVDYVFSECKFFNSHSLQNEQNFLLWSVCYVLYFTLARSKLEYTSLI
jgi:hypothetical protein